MKKIIVFALVLAVFIIPPLQTQFFSPPKIAEIQAVYPFPVFLLAVFAFSLYRFYSLKELQEKIKRAPIVFCISFSTICFGTLCLFSAAFEFLSFFLKIESNQKILPPQNAIQWINFAVGTPCAAFSEEFVYRLFLPEQISQIIGRKKKIFRILAEVVPLALFSAGHFYLGFFGVANAVAGGIALRLCIIKSRSLFSNVVVHALYNFCSFALLWILN